MGHQGQISDVTGEITARVREISLGAPEGPSSQDAANGSASQATRAQHPSLVEVRSAGDLGKGVFAVEDIARGTRIISEAPLLVVQPASTHEVVEEHIGAFCTALRDLPAEGLKILEELCCDQNLPDVQKEQAQRLIHQWNEEHGDEKGHKLNTRKLRRADNRALTRFFIFVANKMGMGRGCAYGEGLFPLYSRINHSCSPNAVSTYNPTIERLIVHASRAIKAGEQVFIEYTNVTFKVKGSRQSTLLENWGFECQCNACTDPEEEALRAQMVELDIKATLPEMYPDMLFARTKDLEEVVPTRQQALEANEEIAALLRHPIIDLQSIPLCRIYRRCARNCLELGDIQKAREYARKELEVEEAVIGTETKHLEEDLVGAKYWLEYLDELV